MLSATYGHEAHLYWYQERYSKKIKLDRMLVNVAILYTIVDYCGYQAFCQGSVIWILDLKNVIHLTLDWLNFFSGNPVAQVFNLFCKFFDLKAVTLILQFIALLESSPI
jgi:hypothetical protein